MADKNLCVVPVLNNEDSSGKGIVSNYGGRRTRFGIDEKFNPDMPESFWTAPAAEAQKIASDVLTTKYWLSLFDGITSNRAACKLFDVCVNTGDGEGVVLAQRALIASGANITDDGKFGPATQEAVNSVPVDKFIANLCAVQKAYYEHICAVAPTPSHLAQIDGWRNRAKFVPDASMDAPATPAAPVAVQKPVVAA